ncbi:hypothetical protein GYMLUDRAFT_88520 [Collybiopsis luxurians FD-317 M1]|uniref:Aminoglycoside phosphotransferase domain-containing protein n=1 Tax=Collybiopsis luxurians FD-317 M1 TaxID=944289 RepID=A0A0D0BTR4_9AGAR|nr:hypothetical protein GYMLUDRAFT_88520 [Collybiopsis luxurians FD-317 M1]
MGFISASFLCHILAFISSTGVYAVPYSAQDANQLTRIERVPLRERVHVSARLTRPAWLGPRYDHSQILTAEDKKAFSSQLEGLKLGSRLKFDAESAKQNRGIWTVKEYQQYGGVADGLLVKIMPDSLPDMHPDDVTNQNFGEVKALRLVDDLVAAGLIEDPNHGVTGKIKDKVKSVVKPSLQKIGPPLVPAVILKKKKGVDLYDLKPYQEASVKERLRMHKAIKELTCQEVARIALEKLVYHGDRHLGNVLITMAGNKVVSIELIDWGKSYMVRKNAMPAHNDVYDYCMATTKFFEEEGVGR